MYQSAWCIEQDERTCRGEELACDSALPRALSRCGCKSAHKPLALCQSKRSPAANAEEFSAHAKHQRQRQCQRRQRLYCAVGQVMRQSAKQLLALGRARARTLQVSCSMC